MYCIRTLPRGGLFLGSRDVLWASTSGHLSGLGKSLGCRGCTTQYIPPLGSVRIQYCSYERVAVTHLAKLKEFAVAIYSQFSSIYLHLPPFSRNSSMSQSKMTKVTLQYRYLWHSSPTHILQKKRRGKSSGRVRCGVRCASGKVFKICQPVEHCLQDGTVCIDCKLIAGDVICIGCQFCHPMVPLALPQ